MDRQSVLIADDDASLAENIAEILEALDVHVSVVATGAEALAMAKSRAFDLALVDVRLPDADGTELIPRLRAASPVTEVVLITGDASVESAMAAVHGGAFAYLLKPVSPPDLLDTSRRALAQVSLRRERERLQRDLERSERRHREVVEAVPALVIALDGQGRVALWNRRLEELTGFARHEMLGQPGADLIKHGGVRPLALKGGGERLVRWERAEVGGTDAEETWVYAVPLASPASTFPVRR